MAKTPHPIRYWRFMKNERLLSTAKRLGISESYLSLIETGKRPLRPELAEKVSKKLGISYLSLIETGKRR
jgi:transcriptional regulator with XRE-family HTH domain